MEPAHSNLRPYMVKAPFSLRAKLCTASSAPPQLLNVPLLCNRGFLYAFLGLASFVVWTQGGFAEQAILPCPIYFPLQNLYAAANELCASPCG